MKLNYINYIPSVSQFKIIKELLLVINFDDLGVIAYNVNDLKLVWKSTNEVCELFYYSGKMYSYDLYEYDSLGNVVQLVGVSKVLSKDYGENYELKEISRNGLMLISSWAYDIESEFYHIYDLKSKRFIKKNIVDNGVISFYNDAYVVSRSKGIIKVYNYNSNEIILEKDFSEECKYYDSISERYFDGQVMNVYEYDGDKIIVTTKNSKTYCYSIVTGEETWRLDYYAYQIEIMGNIGFATTGLSLYKIDLKTGMYSSYGWENERLPNFTYDNKEFWPSGKKIIYYNNLLWYPVFSEGEAFILVINPLNGKYEHIHNLGISEKVMDIKKNDNMIYLLDSANTLHILKEHL